MTPCINLPGGHTWYFDPPPRFFWKEIFSGTHPHVVIVATSYLYYIID